MSDNTAEEEEKITVSKKELEDIIDQRVEKKLQEEKSTEAKNKDEEKEISRRNFLKKLGVGTVGLGALSLVPGSALNVRSDGFSFYGGDGSGLDFDVDNSGNVEIPNGNLDVSSSISFGTSALDGGTLAPNNSENANDGPILYANRSVNIAIDADNASSGFRNFNIIADGTQTDDASARELFSVNDNGNTFIQNGDLEVGNTSGGDVRIAGELTENASI